MRMAITGHPARRLASIAAMVCIMLAVDTRHVPIELGNWVVIPQQHFHFHLKFTDHDR